MDNADESVLAVGHFDGGADDSIMVFDAKDKNHAPLCYRVNESTHTLDGC